MRGGVVVAVELDLVVAVFFSEKHRGPHDHDLHEIVHALDNFDVDLLLPLDLQRVVHEAVHDLFLPQASDRWCVLALRCILTVEAGWLNRKESDTTMH
jgi:hypothetical protein